ncbi:MAG: sugar phosphate isomerase/epimerase [Lachnospiraceae bacterium]|nr:sugar phosphate isomerase/epimerase [Lachnospiraceae bacterium]
MRKWKIGISSVDEAPDTAPLLLKGSVEENLRKAKELGYDAIEIHTRENVDWDMDAIRSCMAKTGIEISQIITGRLNTEGGCSLIDDRPYVEKACVEGMKTYIDMASELGAGIVIGWGRGNPPAGKSRELYRRRLARNLKILNDYGKEKNVRINIEVINHYEMVFFTTCAETAAFIDEFGLDNCFIHLDTYHMQLEENNMAEAVRQAGDKLGYVHIADSQRWYPGSGEMRFEPIFEALSQVGYKGYVTVECFPKGDNELTARKAIEYLDRVIG